MHRREHRKVEHQHPAERPKALHRKAGSHGRRKRQAKRRRIFGKLHGKEQRIHPAQPRHRNLAGQSWQPRGQAQQFIRLLLGHRRGLPPQRAAGQTKQPGADRQRETEPENLPESLFPKSLAESRPVEKASPLIEQRRKVGICAAQFAGGQQRKPGGQQHTKRQFSRTPPHRFGNGSTGFGPPAANRRRYRAPHDPQPQEKLPERQRDEPGHAVQQDHRIGLTGRLHPGTGQHPVDGGQVPGQHLPDIPVAAVRVPKRERRALRLPAKGPETRVSAARPAKRLCKRRNAEQKRRGKQRPEHPRAPIGVQPRQ